MKVVLFCGGLGLRMGEGSAKLPKPMVPVGDRPILLHIMRYYAHFGHRDFILCLGHNGAVIKHFFRTHRAETVGWNITFVETGLTSNVGQRLRAVERLLDDDEIFLANYGDGLSDFSLPLLIDRVRQSDKVGAFICTRPTFFFHMVNVGDDDVVTGIEDHRSLDLWINGGYFCFRREIFDYIRDGEELVEEPFHRLIEKGELLGLRHEGFWAPMDTLKDKQRLDALAEHSPPWAVWEKSA
jgi:glucose-1-phosphate cytidylyltransferase